MDDVTPNQPAQTRRFEIICPGCGKQLRSPRHDALMGQVQHHARNCAPLRLIASKTLGGALAAEAAEE